MPNRTTHVVIAAMFSGAVSNRYSTQIPDLQGRIVYQSAFVMGGIIGGILPDRLDPPTNPRHRGIAHSFLTGILTVSFGISWLKWFDPHLKATAIKFREEWEHSQHQNIAAFLQYICVLFVSGITAGVMAGYLSHLALDANTPAGLPLISA